MKAVTSGKPNPARRIRVFVLAALGASLVMTPLALWYVASTGTQLKLHLVVSMALGITLSLVLAVALMGLLFHSSASGHDRRAANDGAADEPED